MANKKINPLHPGVVLLEDLMRPFQLSQNQLARDLGIPPRSINEIVQGKRGITAQMALRLARYFKMSAEFWLGLQKDFELEVGRDKFASRINKEVKVFKKRNLKSA